MSQLLTQKRCPEAKSRPTALVGLLVMIAAITVPIGFAAAQGPQPVFSDDFETGDFNVDWTEVINFEVIPDPTGESSFVASVVDIADGNKGVLVKEGLSLGPGTIARVFFYDDGAQYGDDHAAALDGDLGSIEILARFSEDSDPSSPDFYIFAPHRGAAAPTTIPRTVGWHEFRFTITSAGARAYIDGAFVGADSVIIAAEMFGIESEGGSEAYWDDVAILPILDVPLDIKPGSDPNSINLKSKGVVPVAVLTTADFDATTVDPETVLFADAPSLRWAIEDVDEDGDLDLLIQFKTPELLAVLDENSTVATLTGYTHDGASIWGTDLVDIVPNG